jgi:hypothetical protein
MAVLVQAHRQHPTDRDVLMALVSIARDTGDLATAVPLAEWEAREVGGSIRCRRDLCWNLFGAVSD